MFYYLNGIVAHKEAYLAVIDCGGVGYACRTTAYTLSALNIGEKAKLYTHVNVKEDAFDIYGFSTTEELHLFQQLIGVSGVGPKAGLAILSSNTPANLAMSIITGDERALTSAPGVGKKIAQRVILELKDKLAKGQVAAVGESYGGTGVTIIPENKASEAAAALAVLGYSREEINAALRGIDMEGMALEQIIRTALRGLAGNIK
jgi:Holliday junction DNA helicase RuvA